MYFIARIATACILLLLGSTAFADDQKRLGIANEEITYKGIPFNKPGVHDQLEALCNAKNSRHGIITLDLSIQKSFLCNIEYGNLNDQNFTKITPDADWALQQIEIEAQKVDVIDLVKLLSEKYGSPKIQEEKVSNKLGTLFDKHTFIWTDRNGTRLMVESIYKTIDEGRVLIQSAPLVKREVDIRKQIEEYNKSNL